MPEIRVIEPIIFAPAEKLRVCAYARVSSDSTDQRNSFASQVNYYTKYIQAHEGWTFVDIYADQGITGTSALKRDEFLRLMRDCRQGKIDRILVKSVSRFARNAQDCIEAVRELRQLGVTVYFEKEHINTANMSNEMFLSMMSAFAQEESISISKNMRKGAVMRMKNGTFRLSQAPYGYYLDEKGILIVQQEESKIVQRIFGNFLSGMGIQEIAAELQKEHIPKLNGEPIWSYTGILYILTNERYIGDELFQKRYTTDTLPFQKKINRGQKKQYYAEDTHDPIISREVFRKAQELLKRKSERHGHQNNGQYALSERTVCGECGAMYRRTMWIKRDRTKEDVWRCVNRLEFGTKYCKHSPSLKEPILHQAILNCIQSVFHNKEEIAEAVREAQKKIILFEDAKNNPEVIRQRMQDIDHGMANLLTLAAQSSQIELFEKKFKEMTEEKARLTEQLKQAEEDATTDAKRQKQLDDILKAIDIDIVELTEFDDTFIRRIVEQVTILSKDKIEVRFIGGFSKVGDIPTK